MKKTLAMVLALVLVLAAAPMCAASADAGDVIEIEFYTSRTLASASASFAETPLDEDNFVEQYLREHLGVDIFFNHTDDLETNLALRLMSDDIPEIMNIPNRNFLNKYADEGYLLNLDEHTDVLADAFAFTQGNAASGKVNGVTYAIAGRPYGYRQAYWYNVNAFNAAGITELPTTLDEYVEALRTVVAATSDGTANSIAFTGAGWDTLCRFFGCYGVTCPNVLSLDENGDVVDTMLTPEFYEALVNIHNLWDEGIIDHEIFAINNSQAIDMAKTGQAVTIYTQWPGIKKVGDWANFTAIDPDAQWEIVGELTGPKGDNYVGHFASSGFTSLTAIDADADEANLEAALKVLNFFATDEGLSLTTYGIEGTHWDYNAEGVPTVREEAIPEIDFSWAYQLCGREELSYCRVKFGDYAWKYVVQSDEQPYITDVTSLIDFPEWYNSTDAKTFIAEECAKFVSGERELNETEWAAFLSTLDSTFRYNEFLEYANGFWHELAG